MKSEEVKPENNETETGTVRSEKPKLRIKSMTTILWRYFVLFVAVVVIAIALICYLVASSSVLYNIQKRLRAVGEDLTTSLADTTVSERALYQKLSNYIVSDGIDLFICSEGGEALIHNSTLTEEKLREISGLILDKMGKWEDGTVKEFNSYGEEYSVLNHVTCVTLRSGERAYMDVRYPINTVTHTLRQMELYVLVVTVVAFAISFLVSYMIARKLSGPIREVTGTAQELAKGNYSVQFGSAQYEEIAQLSDTLNYMKEEIKKSGDFQKELVANVSHDLKTPLTMIKAYASMIREISGDDPEKRDKHLQVIIDESDRLTGLVNDILSASKIIAGLDQSNTKIINLTELLYSVINKFSYLQDTQEYRIMVDVEPNLYTSAVEEQIYQVVYNLISNAINYTGNDKTIFVTLKTDEENRYIKFAVRDTGKGIDDEELAHIWDRYYRSKDSHVRPVKGTGLGLNIVKEILQRHSFEFGVNTEKGKGSTFFVNFPIA